MLMCGEIVVLWVALIILGAIFYWILKLTDPTHRNK